MNDELYYEILCNSVDNEKDIEFHFNCFKSIKNSLYKNSNLLAIDFYSINDLIEFSNKETIISVSYTHLTLPTILLV